MTDTATPVSAAPSLSVAEIRSPEFRQMQHDAYARDLARLLDDFRPDVIHQHGQFMDLTWATGAYARRRGCARFRDAPRRPRGGA